MKKTLYILSAALVLASCAKELSPEPKRIATRGDLVINAYPEAFTGDTKAIHGTTSFMWEANEDQIAVFHYDDVIPMTCTESGDKGAFSTDLSISGYALADGDVIQAVYPIHYSRNWSQDCALMQLNTQMQVGNNSTDHLQYSDFMVSDPVTLDADNFDGDVVAVDLTMHHLLSKLNIAISNEDDEDLEIYNVVYSSSLQDDVLSGPVSVDLNAMTIAPTDPADIYMYGDIPNDVEDDTDGDGIIDEEFHDPAKSFFLNSQSLQVKDVTIASGEEASLWMWMLPVDFTESNSAGRTLTILVSTNKGVYRIAGINLDYAFESGKVYWQGVKLKNEDLIPGITFIPDNGFAANLMLGNYSNGEKVKGYTYDGSNFTEITGTANIRANKGIFVKNSEARTLEEIAVLPLENKGNVVSFTGIQAFSGLKRLEINGEFQDMALQARALDLSTMTQLDTLILCDLSMQAIDLSNNTALRSLLIGDCPNLRRIIGFDNLASLEEVQLGAIDFHHGMELNFTQPNLKLVAVNDDESMENGNCLFDFTGSKLDLAAIYVQGAKVILDDSQIDSLCVYSNIEIAGTASPIAMNLQVNPTGDNRILAQIQNMDRLKYLELTNWDANYTPELAFGPKNSALEAMNTPSSFTFSGLENLTGLKSLCAHVDNDLGKMDLSGMSSLETLQISYLDGYHTCEFTFGPKNSALDSLWTESIMKHIGLDNLTGLKFLMMDVCSDHVDLDLSGMTSLTRFEGNEWSTDQNYYIDNLVLPKANLEYIDLSNVRMLTDRTKTYDFDFSNMPKLKYVSLPGSIVPNGKRFATDLEYYYNVNLEGSTALEEVYSVNRDWSSDGFSNAHINLGTSTYPNLKKLEILDSWASTLDVSKIPNIEYLKVGGGIENLDLRSLSSLRQFRLGVSWYMNSNSFMRVKWDGSALTTDFYSALSTQGTFTISQSQYNSAKNDAGEWFFSGITSSYDKPDDSNIEKIYNVQ